MAGAALDASAGLAGHRAAEAGARVAVTVVAVVAALLVGGVGGFAIGHATAGNSGAGQHQFRERPNGGYGFPGFPGRTNGQNQGGSNT